MKLSSSNINKILIFSQRKVFLIFSQKKSFLIFPKTEPCTSQPNPKQIKRSTPKKNSLYFQKRNFLALILKKFLYFLKRKLFLYFLKIKLFIYFFKRKLFLYFQKWNPAFFSPSSKNKKNPSEKISYASGNGNPEKTSYIFSKENCSDISGNGKLPKFFYISGNRTFRAQKILFLFHTILLILLLFLLKINLYI